MNLSSTQMNCNISGSNISALNYILPDVKVSSNTFVWYVQIFLVSTVFVMDPWWCQLYTYSESGERIL